MLEREQRILSRVTAPEVSSYFHNLHRQHGVLIHTGKQVEGIQQQHDAQTVVCADGSEYAADLIIIGVGIRINTELAEQAGLDLNNGIVVDSHTRTSDPNIFAIGDCTNHFNPHYGRRVRLESVQNAADQAKVAAAAMCGNDIAYDKIPWFWSDQYDVKLQVAGLFTGYETMIARVELDKKNCLSAWYFQGEQLLAVDAVNNPKAYVLGTRLIKSGQKINKKNLADPRKELSLDHIWGQP